MDDQEMKRILDGLYDETDPYEREQFEAYLKTTEGQRYENMMSEVNEMILERISGLKLDQISKILTETSEELMNTLSYVSSVGKKINEESKTWRGELSKALERAAQRAKEIDEQKKLERKRKREEKAKERKTRGIRHPDKVLSLQGKEIAFNKQMKTDKKKDFVLEVMKDGEHRVMIGTQYTNKIDQHTTSIVEMMQNLPERNPSGYQEWLTVGDGCLAKIINEMNIRYDEHHKEMLQTLVSFYEKNVRRSEIKSDFANRPVIRISIKDIHEWRGMQLTSENGIVPYDAAQHYERYIEDLMNLNVTLQFQGKSGKPLEASIRKYLGKNDGIKNDRLIDGKIFTIDGRINEVEFRLGVLGSLLLINQLVNNQYPDQIRLLAKKDKNLRSLAVYFSDMRYINNHNKADGSFAWEVRFKILMDEMEQVEKFNETREKTKFLNRQIDKVKRALDIMVESNMIHSKYTIPEITLKNWDWEETKIKMIFLYNE